MSTKLKRRLSSSDKEVDKSARQRSDAGPQKDNDPKVINPEFFRLVLKEMDLVNLTENVKFGSLRYTLRYSTLFNDILGGAIDQNAMFRYFFNEIRIPLERYMEISGTAIQPTEEMDWPDTWKDMRKEEEEIGISFLFRNSIKKVIRNLLLPFRDGRSGTRGDGDGSQSTRSTTFRKELHTREASTCPITGVLSDASTNDPPHDGFKGPLEGAHIIPHHLTGNTDVYKMIKNFAGKDVLKGFSAKVDHVSNGILMDVSCHKAFDKLQWSIQANLTGPDTYEYIVRRTRQRAPDAGLATSHLTEGKRLVFGATSTLAKPDPEYCNLHLAVAGVVHAVGMAEILDVVDRDDDYDDFMAWLDQDAHTEQPKLQGSGAPPGDIGTVETIILSSKPDPSETTKAATPLPGTTQGYGVSDKAKAGGRPRSDSCGSETHKEVKEKVYNQDSSVY